MYEYCNRIDNFYKGFFNRKITKVAISAGFSCPNRDGLVSVGGCTFCGGEGSGDFAVNLGDFLASQQDFSNSLAYLQSFSNTYAPAAQLDILYRKILQKGVAGLVIATRADCLGAQVLAVIKALVDEGVYISVELGLQTAHENTAKAINRGFGLELFKSAVAALKEIGVRVCIHLINGLEGETKEMMVESARIVSRILPHSIKIHMLGIIKGSQLCRRYEKQPFALMSKDEYITTVCDQIEVLDPNIYIQRLTGDAPKELLIAPLWTSAKVIILNEIQQEMRWRKSFQGSRQQGVES